MGWIAGQGLGKDKQGMKSHIKVKQRAEDEGIGHEKVKVEQASSHWWQGAVNDTLAKLNQSGTSSSNKKSKKKKSKKKSKKSKVVEIKTYTDEELFIATGGARFGMRAQRKQEGKWARAESGISQAEEISAMAAVEWNGTGKAKFASDLLLAGTKTRILAVGESSGSELEDMNISNGSTPKMKKRKREILNENESTESENLEESKSDVNKEKRKKKKKKEYKKADKESGESAKKKRKKESDRVDR